VTLEEVLRRTLADLAGSGVDCAAIGGLAVGVRTDPRFTRDVDLAVRVRSDKEAERVVNGLIQRGYQLRYLLEQSETGRLATARLVPRYHSEVFVDLLFASSGVEPEVVDAAELIEVKQALHVKVATVPHLIALKVLSRDDIQRPQDRIDLVKLLEKATAEDLRVARETLKKIRDRGYHRGKDLLGEFAELAGGQIEE
jgi:predicted nucleotidyltransferase